MAFDDYSYLAFIGIVVFDVSTLCFAVYLWSKYRQRIISLVHNGFGVKIIHLKKLLKIKKKELNENKNFNAVKANSLIIKKETNLFFPNKSFSTAKFDEKINEASPSIDNFGMYMKLSSESIGTEDIPGAKRLARNLYKYKYKNSWWTYFMYNCSRRIQNSEAILYLKFMGRNCKMMLICFLFSIIINGLVFLVFLIQRKPYTFLTYTFQDMLNCNITTWALYLNTWVYSFVTYYFILKFRNELEGNRQVTAILRPQLHTLMVAGLKKSIKSPSEIHDHFDSYFSGQILAVHIVKDHSRRLILENKLESAKKQLAGLYDRVSIHPGVNVLRRSSESKQMSELNIFESDDEINVQRSNSDYQLREEFKRADSAEQARSFSCHNLQYCPSKENKEDRTGNLIDREIYDHYGKMKNKFVNVMMTIKRLKAEIEEEKNKLDKPTARVCFVSFADSNLVIHMLKDKKILESMYNWYISPAPHPKDIIWLNLSKSRLEVFIRGFIFNALIISFYSLVTYFLSKMNMIKKYNTENENDEVMGQLIRSSFWQGIIQSLVTMFINSAVHPNLIFILSKYIGIWTHTQFQKFLLFEHILYLFTSTIFVPLLASMIAIWRVFDGDVNLLSVELGRILINTSWKYVTIYIINATLLVPCNQMLQITPLSLRYLNHKVLKTDDGVPFFDLGYWYAYHLSIVTLVISFGLFIPYLLPLAALYFALRFYVDRHNVAYGVWQFPFDNSGEISKRAIKSMLLCVSIMQFMMSGVFSQNKNLPSFLIAILYIAPVTTWLVMYGSYTDTVIQSISSFYELSLKPLSQKMIQIIQVCYMHPCDIKDLIEFCD